MVPRNVSDSSALLLSAMLLADELSLSAILFEHEHKHNKSKNNVITAILLYIQIHLIEIKFYCISYSVLFADEGSGQLQMVQTDIP